MVLPTLLPALCEARCLREHQQEKQWPWFLLGEFKMLLMLDHYGSEVWGQEERRVTLFPGQSFPFPNSTRKTVLICPGKK